MDDPLDPQRPVPSPHRGPPGFALTSPRRQATRRRFRWRSGAAVTALALAAALAFGAVLWHRYRASGLLAGDLRRAVVRQLEASLGRSVSLGGITGDLVHRIVLRDLRIAERGGFDHGATFSAAEVRLTFNWSRLFSTRLDV
ncbi:MAG TPA: hypothetical protein VK881_13925, partial [bacterium]|nr:hypothetical protein [bacterium]